MKYDPFCVFFDERTGDVVSYGMLDGKPLTVGRLEKLGHDMVPVPEIEGGPQRSWKRGISGALPEALD